MARPARLPLRGARPAAKLLDALDPERSVFGCRLYREHCTPLEGCYTKDLRALGRPLSSTILVENTPLSCCYQPGNAVLVPEGYRIKPIPEEAKKATARFGSQAHTSAVGDSQGAQLSDSSCQLRRSRQAIGLCAVRPQLRSRSQVS